jgi:hypothetical protein
MDLGNKNLLPKSGDARLPKFGDLPKFGECAPNINKNSKNFGNYTCFTLEELIELANAYNNFHNFLNSKKLIVIKNKNKKQLWKSIDKRLKSICNNESCWIEQKFLNSINNKTLVQKLKYYTFKPKMTRGQYSWLNTNNINEVFLQYEKLFNYKKGKPESRDFYFAGALPSDFYKYKKFNNDILNKYKYIGFVFNHDSSKKPGSHWVAFFIDNNKKTIEYFDSIGSPPTKLINNFIKIIRKQLPNYIYLENAITHQLQNSECGVYSIYYILQRLMGKSFYYISNNIVRDSHMNKFRNYIFRPRNSSFRKSLPS